MDKKKRRLVVILPVVSALVVVGAVITLVLSVAAAPAGSAPREDSVTAEQAVPACDFAGWVGHAVDEAVVKETGRPYRVLPPGSAATMDYSAERINLETDDSGVVVKVTCG